jgi:hypothetical protein
LPRRSFVRACLHRSGFEVRRTLSSGLEDYAFGRRLPPRLFIRVAPLADRARFLPSQFVLARKLGESAPGRLPAWNRMLACPICAIPFGLVETEVRQDRICSKCGFVTRIREGWVDGRADSDSKRASVPPNATSVAN